VFVVDTNVLIYAADQESPYYSRCRELLESWRTSHRLVLTWRSYTSSCASARTQSFSQSVACSSGLEFRGGGSGRPALSILIPATATPLWRRSHSTSPHLRAT